ncbi:MAG: PEP-CTERM sorting domain-containing protein [Mariniblastus sp.]
MKLQPVFLAIVVLLCASFSNSHADILIDSFTDGNPLTKFGVGSASGSTTASSILGGQRDESLTVRNLGGDEFFGAFGFGGEWSVGQGSNDQMFGELVYDDFTSFDLTDGGMNSRFSIGFQTSDTTDPIPDVLSVTAISGATSATQFLTIPSNTAAPAELLVDFSQFGGVNFTQLDSIRLDVDFGPSQAGRDFEISRFSAVPEPATAGVVGLGGLFVLLRRRRRS